MSLVRVYNDNIHPYKEKFKGNEIKIPAKGYVEMNYFDAVDFKGQFTAIEVDGGGSHKPTSFKMLRIVKPEGFGVEDARLSICNSCGEKFATSSLLSTHVQEFHVEQLVDKEEREKHNKRRLS